jgi:DNA-binding CsgD family transcriptional regulator/tetratricopeptide (TPR) repeat protein
VETASPLIARHRELQLLEDCLMSARSGQAGVILIHGEAGLGKSRLAETMIDQASGSDVLVTRGHCTPVSGSELPFGPFVEMLSHLAARSEAGDEAAQATWALVRPVLTVVEQSTGVASPDVGLARSRLFTSVLRILHYLGQRQPVIALIEDIHWADSSSLDLLNYLARTAGQERLLLVLTCRDDAVARDSTRRSISELGRADATRVVHLKPLTAHEVRQLLAESDVRLPATQHGRVVDLCDGNPFIALELASRAEIEGAHTEALRQALLSPVDDLPEEARFALHVAAVLGQDIPHEVLERAIDSVGADVVANLRLLTQRGLLTVGGEQYLFRHAIVRESVVREMLPGEREAAHGAAVHGIQHSGRATRPAGFAQLAHHLVASSQYTDALPVVMAAAEYARGVYAFSEARRQLSVARRVLWHRVDEPEEGSGVTYPELIRREAEMARWAGEPERAAQLIRQGLTTLPRGGLDRTRLELELGEALWAAGDPAGALAAYEWSEAALGQAPDEPALRAKVLAALARGLTVTAQYDLGREAAGRAIALAGESGAARVALQARITLATVIARRGDLEGGAAELRRCLTEAFEHEAFEAIVRCYGNLAFLYSAAGQLPQVLEIAEEGDRTCRRFGPLLLVAPTLVESWIHALVATGRWDEAERVSEELNQQWPAAGMGLALTLQLAHIPVARGDTKQFQQMMAVIQGFARPDDPYASHDVALLRAEHLLWQGEPAQAYGITEKSLRELKDQQDGAFVLSMCSLALRAYADVLLTAADRSVPEQAADATASLLAVAREAATRDTEPLGRANLVLCQAEAARAARAATAEAWHAVATSWLGLGCPFPAAYAQWREAEELFGRHARSQGTRALAAAYRTATTLRAHPLEESLRMLARFAGVQESELGDDHPRGSEGAEPAPPLVDLPVQLTPRERDVLLLLTKGLSNQQIARRLFISESTASVHVSHVIAKLGVSNRLQAAAAAHRLHLFPDEV